MTPQNPLSSIRIGVCSGRLLRECRRRRAWSLSPCLLRYKPDIANQVFPVNCLAKRCTSNGLTAAQPAAAHLLSCVFIRQYERVESVFPGRRTPLLHVMSSRKSPGHIIGKLVDAGVQERKIQLPDLSPSASARTPS